MNDEDLIRRKDAIAAICKSWTDDELILAINSLPAVQVTVKPLEWEQLDGLPSYDICEVLTVFGRYKVQQASGSAYALLVYPNGTISQQPTLEAAKAAAQADYDARIRAALA